MVLTNKEEELREAILYSYNLLYDEEGVQDNIGIIEAAKENFKLKVDLLIKTIIDRYEKETPNY